MKTVIGLFTNYQDAEQAVQQLQNHNFDKKQIKILSSDQVIQQSLAGEQHPLQKGAAIGAIGGAVIGAIIGTLAGGGYLLIPGLVAFIAVGTLVGAIIAAIAGAAIGALIGGIIGALVGLGVRKKDVLFYAEGLERGGVLLRLDTSDDRAVQALGVLQAVNMTRQGARRHSEEPARPVAEYEIAPAPPVEYSRAVGEAEQPRVTPPAEELVEPELVEPERRGNNSRAE